MTLALRVEINTIAACLLMILIANKRSVGKNMPDEHLYQLLLYTTLFYAVSDAVAWVLNGMQFPGIVSALYLVNIFCYLCCVIIPYLWCLYAEFRLSQDEKKLAKLNRFCRPIVAAYVVIVASTPLTGWMFSFNERNMYQRGPLFVLQVVLSLFFVMFPTVRAVLQLRNAESAFERKECYSIGGFVISPLIGLGIQVLFYGIPAAVITIVLAEMMIFVNIQNKQISLDSLTGLNNRGHLNRYLNIQTKKEFQNKKMYMLLLDIDFFKRINDTYGHKVGDQALIDMAFVLKSTFGRQGDFLARYGGDEFAIIIEKRTDAEVEQVIEEIQNAVRNFNDSNIRPYKLSVSVGYALFGTDTVKTMDQLIEAADNQMYLLKEKRHAVSMHKRMDAAIN